MGLPGRTDHLVRDVHRRDVHGTPGEVDADGLPGVGMQAEPLDRPAAPPLGRLGHGRDDGAAVHQGADDVVQRRAGQAAQLAQVGPAERAVGAQQPQDEFLVSPAQSGQGPLVFEWHAVRMETTRYYVNSPE